MTKSRTSPGAMLTILAGAAIVAGGCVIYLLRGPAILVDLAQGAAWMLCL